MLAAAENLPSSLCSPSPSPTQLLRVPVAPCLRRSPIPGAACVSAGATAWGGDGIILAWNVVAMGRDGNPAGGTTELVECDDGAATNEAQKVDEEESCGAATGAREWGGAGVIVACGAAATGRDAVPAGCLTR